MRPVCLLALVGCGFRGNAKIDDAAHGDGTVDNDAIADAPDDAMIDARVEPFVPPGGVAAPIILWIAAEDAAHDGALNVTGWPDRGPGRHDLVVDAALTAPKLVRQTALSPLVKFANSHMTASSLFPMGSTTTTLSTWIVFRDDTSADFDWIYYEGTIGFDRYSLSRSYNNDTRLDIDITTANRLETDIPDRATALLGTFGNESGLVAGTGSEMAIFVDGSSPSSLSPFDHYVGTGQMFELANHVGAGDSSNNGFDGAIGEMYVLNGVPSSSDIDKVDTYFALRYGLLLEHNYKDSSGTTVFSVSTGYANRVFGLANDAAGGLDVRAATSAIGSELLIMRAPAMPAGRAYAVAGDENGSLTFDGTSRRLDRYWRIDNTNWNVPIEFDVAATGSTAKVVLPISNTQTLSLVVDNTNAFLNATVVPMTKQPDGRWTATAPLPLGGASYFTFLVAP